MYSMVFPSSIFLCDVVVLYLVDPGVISFMSIGRQPTHVNFCISEFICLCHCSPTLCTVRLAVCFPSIAVTRNASVTLINSLICFVLIAVLIYT